MANSFIDTATKAVKHWYLFLIAGLIFIAAGVWVLATPLSSYLTLSTIFSVSFLVSGFGDIAFSISNRKQMKGWGWNLVSGIVNVLIGFLLISNPLISITTLPLYVGLAILFRSVMAIGTAIDFNASAIPGSDSLILMGILGVLFSFVLLWNPGFAGLSLVTWTALALFTAGVYSMYYSFQLKKLNAAGSQILA